jgi:hypothetical protein
MRPEADFQLDLHEHNKTEDVWVWGLDKVQASLKDALDHMMIESIDCQQMEK